MRKLSLFVGILIGFVFGVYFTGIAIELAAPHALFKEIRSPYNVDKTVQIIVNRIKKQPNWHVVEVINQEKEIIKHGGPDVGSVKIIKLCNAKLAGDMLMSDDRKFFAVDMPASIAVYEKSDGKTYISVANSAVMSKLFRGKIRSIIEDVIRDAEQIMGFVHFRYTIF